MQTTILGQAYEGRPAMNSIALRVFRLEEDGNIAEAMTALRSHNMIRAAFGQPCHDLQSDMTSLRMEGVDIYPATKGTRADVE